MDAFLRPNRFPMDINQASFCEPERHQTDAKKILPNQGLDQGSIVGIDATPGKLAEESIKDSERPSGAGFPPGHSLAFVCGFAIQGRAGDFSRHGRPPAAELERAYGG